MNHDLVLQVADRFESFATAFLNDPGETFAFRLKIEHTKRVLANAEHIAREEGLPDRLVIAGRLAALLHDVGRFPQYREFKTFRDPVSANHAALSVTHILREKLLEGVPGDIKRRVLGAVYLHNKRTLPPLRDKELDTVARVIRDSDKLDIYGVMIAHFAQDKPKHPEIALHVKDVPDAYTTKITDTLLRREPGDYADLVYINDFKLMTIGWLYDLNFRASLRMLKQRGHLDTLFESLPKVPAINAFQKQIDEDLARRLEDA